MFAGQRREALVLFSEKRLGFAYITTDSGLFLERAGKK
jgi:hypothetical protein